MMEMAEEEITRILVVDDDKDEGVLFSKKLDELDLPHSTTSVLSCYGLFRYLEQNPLPHIIFMDVNMPLPNGLECVRKLKEDERYKHIPVVMYSFSSAEADINEAYESGAHYYVVKPHSPANLAPTLKKALTPDWRKPQPVAPREEFVINISYSD